MVSRPLESSAECARPLPGDDFVPDARAQITHDLTIDAPPAAVWPLLLSMVEREAPKAYDMLLCAAPRALVLGALHDHGVHEDLPFATPRPAHFWQATWALVLEPLDAARTHLFVRARVAYTSDAVLWSAVWMHPFNDFMERAELRRLKARAEGHPSTLLDRVSPFLHRLVSRAPSPASRPPR